MLRTRPFDRPFLDWLLKFGRIYALGGFKIKKNGKKERVLSRKERAENEKKNGFSEEGGFKIKKKIERFFGFLCRKCLNFQK
jgi:hypothetical protein